MIIENSGVGKLPDKIGGMYIGDVAQYLAIGCGGLVIFGKGEVRMLGLVGVGIAAFVSFRAIKGIT